MENVSNTVEKIYGNYDEKVLQFGDGNFLRAFVDWMIDGANEKGDFNGSVVICQARQNGNQKIKDIINSQNGIYTVAMRGIDNNQPTEKYKKITSISRCINAYSDYDELLKLVKSDKLQVVVSNTTEAGIVYDNTCKLEDKPCNSFPAKIAQLLYARYKKFNGDVNKGLLFLPVELIDNNGNELKKIVIKHAKDWQLESEFIDWINNANEFTNTLVDRIVTGYPKGETDYFENKLGYVDNAIVTCEIFNLWVIEGSKKWQNVLPISNDIANVLWTDNVKPYKMRKVRILNGGHTSTVLGAYLSGCKIVGEMMDNIKFKSLLTDILYSEVIPTIDLPKDELDQFASDVFARFSNPYVKHNLLDISLNSCSKFNARCLPSLLAFNDKFGKIPPLLTFSFACFIKFYLGKMEDGKFVSTNEIGDKYEIRDDKSVIEFFNNLNGCTNEEIATKVLSNKSFWSDKDLTQIKDLTLTISKYLNMMDTMKIEEIIDTLIGE